MFEATTTGPTSTKPPMRETDITRTTPTPLPEFSTSHCIARTGSALNLDCPCPRCIGTEIEVCPAKFIHTPIMSNLWVQQAHGGVAGRVGGIQVTRRICEAICQHLSKSALPYRWEKHPHRPVITHDGKVLKVHRSTGSNEHSGIVCLVITVNISKASWFTRAIGLHYSALGQVQGPHLELTAASP